MQESDLGLPWQESLSVDLDRLCLFLDYTSMRYTDLYALSLFVASTRVPSRASETSTCTCAAAWTVGGQGAELSTSPRCYTPPPPPPLFLGVGRKKGGVNCRAVRYMYNVHVIMRPFTYHFRSVLLLTSFYSRIVLNGTYHFRSVLLLTILALFRSERNANTRTVEQSFDNC